MFKRKFLYSPKLGNFSIRRDLISLQGYAYVIYGKLSQKTIPPFNDGGRIIYVFNFHSKRFRFTPFVSELLCRAVSYVSPRQISILGGIHLLSFFHYAVHWNIPRFFLSIKVPRKIELDHPFSYLLYNLFFDRVPSASLPTPIG